MDNIKKMPEKIRASDLRRLADLVRGKLPAERIITTILEQRRFKLKAKRIRIDELSNRPEIDLLYTRDGKEFAVEVKQSRDTRQVISHLLPRAIVLLQAVCREKRDYQAIVAVVVDHYDKKFAARLDKYMESYAPSILWVLADQNGRCVCHRRMPAPRMAAESVSDRESDFDPSELTSKPLSFSDLDQWLIKFLIFSRSPSAEKFWRGTLERARNAYQLSKLAHVSAPAANAWVNKMEASGYLKKRGRGDLIPLRPPAMFDEWRGRYRMEVNEKRHGFRLIYPARDNEELVEELLENIRHFITYIDIAKLAISAHLACRLYGLKHVSSSSIHIYCTGNIAQVVKHLKLVPAETASYADLFLIEPKYPQSVFYGAVEKNGFPLCDILQCYLDLYHLPDRGREQADFIMEDIIMPIAREAQSHGR